uniref:Uncharacterized protein n=1 Tax=Oryza barthii TaxID=65489 RepID=A0A0D3F5L4_9ORYZ
MQEEAKPPLTEEQRDLRVSDDGEVVVAASPEEAKPPLTEEQRDLRVSDDGEVVVAASPVGSGDDESDAYVASAVSQWTPTAVPAAVARDLLPRFLCSTWWAHLDDGEAGGSGSVPRPRDPDEELLPEVQRGTVHRRGRRL